MSQGTKRAVTETIAHLLKIQPSIHNTTESSSKRPVARAICGYKSYALRPVLWQCNRPQGKEDAIVLRWMVKDCKRQCKRLL
jgi:hypothetical protein